MLIPVYLWAAFCSRIDNPWGESRWYIVWPLGVLLIITFAWNVALVIAGPSRFFYALYAILFIPVFFILWAVALFWAGHAPI
jgi:hypothetical protein